MVPAAEGRPGGRDTPLNSYKWAGVPAGVSAGPVRAGWVGGPVAH